MNGGKMKQKVQKILFATDLSENCKEAFFYTARLAAKCCSSIIILHVIEAVSESLEPRIKRFLGEEAWKTMQQKHQNSVRATLIGKKSELEMIRQALGSLSKTAQSDECQYSVEKVLVRDGNVVDTILETSVSEQCDLIVTGSNKTIFSDNTSLGSHLKSIFKRSKIPVMMIPPSKK